MLTQWVSLLAFATQAISVPTIAAKGSKLFLDNGEQFFVKGSPDSQSLTKNRNKNKNKKKSWNKQD